MAVALGLACATPAFGGELLYGFGALPDGSSPSAQVVADSAGRLYGVTEYGGPMGYGTVFRLTPPSSGTGPWTEETLHTFSGSDGVWPVGKLLLGPTGEVYGTTSLGGKYGIKYPSGGGVVFRLDNLPGWPITILHSFPGPYQAGGGGINAGVVFGPSGLLYGVAVEGGVPGASGAGNGVAFSLSPQGDATEFAILHRFGSGNKPDGFAPNSGLLPDGANRFFGTTGGGGAYGLGTVFALTLGTNSRWAEHAIYSLGRPGDVAYGTTESGLIHGPHGTLYGCDGFGGAYSHGGMFQLTPPATSGGAWAETLLYSFGAQAGDANPADNCGIALDPSGAIFGDTPTGGTENAGTIFGLYPPASAGAAWTESLIQSFTQDPTYGFPTGPLGDIPRGGLLRVGKSYIATNSQTPGQGPYYNDGGSVYKFTP